MRLKGRKIKFDILLAFTLLVLCSAGTGFAVRKIAITERRGALLSEPLHSGHSIYTVRSRGGCAGQIDLTLNDTEGLLEIRAEGDVVLSLDGEAQPLIFSADLAFNAIGQLVSSLVKAKRADIEGGLGLLEVNPIKATFWLKGPEHSLRHELQIPGPLTIARRGINQYTLNYQPLAALAPKNFGILSSKVKRLIDFEVSYEGEDVGACQRWPKQSVDLSLASVSLKSASRLFAPLMQAAERSAQFR